MQAFTMRRRENWLATLCIGLLMGMGWLGSAYANLPPQVQITQPIDGDVFNASSGIGFTATASDPDDGVQAVQFKVGSHVVNAQASASGAYYAAYWTNSVQPGTYTVTAEARDFAGETSVSQPVTIRILGPQDQPALSVMPFVANTLEGSEDGPAEFSILRKGSVERDITVRYTVGGTATPVIDYQALSESVILPAGQDVISIPVVSLADSLVESQETIEITLQASTSADYSLAQPISASVWIDDKAVVPPSVSLTLLPRLGMYTAGAGTNLLLRAVTRGIEDDSVKAVQYFSNNTLLGTVSVPEPRHVYDFTWSNVPAGQFVLKAIVLMNSGGTNIGVLPEVVIHPTATRPVITISAVDPEATRMETWNHGEFRIERTGDLSLNQNVFYKVAGTAEAGVDYESIGGFVSFSRGESSTSVFVSALRSANRPSSVSVTAQIEPLPASEYGLSPVYEIGTPAEATILILDGAPIQPLTLTIEQTNTSPQVSVSGQAKYPIVLEYSVDLLHWTPLMTNVISEGSFRFLQPVSNDPLRTFRARYR